MGYSYLPFYFTHSIHVDHLPIVIDNGKIVTCLRKCEGLQHVRIVVEGFPLDIEGGPWSFHHLVLVNLPARIETISFLLHLRRMERDRLEGEFSRVQDWSNAEENLVKMERLSCVRFDVSSPVYVTSSVWFPFFGEVSEDEARWVVVNVIKCSLPRINERGLLFFDEGDFHEAESITRFTTFRPHS